MNGNVMQKGKLNRKFLRPFWSRCHQHCTKANKLPIGHGSLNCVHLALRVCGTNVKNLKPQNPKSCLQYYILYNFIHLGTFPHQRKLCDPSEDFLKHAMVCTCEVNFGRLSIPLLCGDIRGLCATPCISRGVVVFVNCASIPVNTPADANFHTWQSSHWCALIWLCAVQLVSVVK